MASRVYECIKRISEKIIENKDYLTDLDREIGDADHGFNMARGFQAVMDKTPQEEEDLGAVLKKCGMTLLSTVGGASGPLYGTAYMEAGKVLAGKTRITAEDMKEALAAAIAGIQKRGRAEKGEKTMLDALIPAYEAFCEEMASAAREAREGVSPELEKEDPAGQEGHGGSGEDPRLAKAMAAACGAAAAGVEYTKIIVATKGRASYLGERSLGHQDPGATSMTMTLEVIRDFLQEQ